MDDAARLEVRRAIGARLRRRRKLLDITMAELGASIDCTYQQVHKYETGGNDPGVVRLFQLAEALDVDVQYFFADLQAVGGRARRELEIEEVGVLRAAKSIAKLSPRVQDRFCFLAESVGGSFEAEDPASPADEASE